MADYGQTLFRCAEIESIIYLSRPTDVGGTNGDRGVLSACGLTDETGVAKSRRVSSPTPSNDTRYAYQTG